MGGQGEAEGDTSVMDSYDVVVPTPPELEITEYPLSNSQLLLLGAAFFATWAGNISFAGLYMDHGNGLCCIGVGCLADLHHPARHSEGIWGF